MYYIIKKMIVSPCISICKTDPVTGYCYGCGRSDEEKKIWKNEDTSNEWKETNLKVIKIKKNMAWCDDVNNEKFYNKITNLSKKIKSEKLFRNDYKYDYFIPIKYNWISPKIPKGSAIFLHLTKDYKKTAGCVAVSLKDFKIILKLIKKNSKIKIY